MSRIKRALIAMGIALMIVVSPTSRAHSTGIPVVDMANLVQSMLQALAWIQQFQQMQQQILQADQQIHAIMGSLMNNLTLAGVVPSDVNAVYHAIRSGGVQGMTAAAQIIRHNRMIYNCEGKTGDALRICQNMLNQTPQSQAYYANTYQMLLGRMQQIRALTTRINQTEDEKGILELNGRIAAEQAQVSNDTNRILTMKSMIEAEEKAAQQEQQERVLKMLAPGTARTFNNMAPWTP